MTDVPYLAERIVAPAGVLAGWSGHRVGSTLRISGGCPACQDDTAAVVPLASSSLEAASASPSVTTRTVALVCDCGQAHAGRPDTPPHGCGRSWVVQANIDDAGRVTLTPVADPRLAEAAEAFRAAADGQLERLRGASEKWIAGISALLGVLAVAGLTLGGDQVRKLAPTGRIAVAVIVAVAVVSAGMAIRQAYRAAYGWPRTRSVADDSELLSWYETQRALPALTADRLRTAVLAAGVALALLTVAAGLTWFLPVAAPSVKVTTRDEATICGTLLSSRADGTLRVRRADDGNVETLQVAAVGRLTAVEKC